MAANNPYPDNTPLAVLWNRWNQNIQMVSTHALNATQAETLAMNERNLAKISQSNADAYATAIVALGGQSPS